ncbi:hypothetical protein BDQ12DRAFT_270495 [Crucibulum laeve]|uniref:DUF3835 domain-containing protein n=1 Tax=Crucibulum laeve TaxID=68775 RepID=A0A5C3MAR0_9AGAR|nr:hypothetical protein BDQ12DRAFT_270495 [Crucibulum laeve]
MLRKIFNSSVTRGLVNEEGLPIIDISEPISASEPKEYDGPVVLPDDPLIPLQALPSVVKERLRQQRDRILDMLEEEERQEQKREEQEEQMKKEETLRKRKDAAANEKERMNTAKELQKKMGKALLRNMQKAKEEEDKGIKKSEAAALERKMERSKADSSKKKSVAFADAPSESLARPESPPKTESIDRGDVILARLRSSNRPTLLSKTQDRLPMKMSVVERVPGGQPTVPSTVNDRDSDDESEPPSPRDDDDDEATMSSLPTETHDSDEELQEDVELEQDEVDFNFAQHQREIALEYHRKRNQVGKDVAAAMMSHSHSGDEEEKDRSLDVPTSEPFKPSISQFKVNRIASAYNTTVPGPSASTSLGETVLPAGSTRTIQRAICTGKLDADNKLVGTDADSASEDENEGMQEVLDLLRKGEVYNIGPDGELVSVPSRVGPWASPTEAEVAAAIAPSALEAPPLPTPLLPLNKLKTSKFKVSRAQAGRPASSSNSSSRPDTPISYDQRSSPKLESPPTAPTVMERKPPSGPVNNIANGNPASPFPMIVDSPSFPEAGSRISPKPPTVISSPSFPPQPSLRRHERPPTVVSLTVRESNNTSRPPPFANTESDGQPKRVSRFKESRG